MDAGERDDITALIADHVPAVEIAHRLIVPLNDVLTVVEELRLADAPRPNRTTALQQPHVVRRPAVVTVPPQERPSMSSSPTVVPSHDQSDPPELAADLLDVFSRARAIVDKRIAKALDAAEKAHAALVDLVEKHERTGAVRARIAPLEAELAAERDKLKVPKAAPETAAPPRPTALGPDASVVRAWAQSAGVEVPAKGPISTRVIDAYRAAHADTRPAVVL